MLIRTQIRAGNWGWEAGKEEKLIPFLCLWVRWFGKFIAPKRHHEAGAAEVEAFLRSLEEGGAEGWKVAQTDEAMLNRTGITTRNPLDSM